MTKILDSGNKPQSQKTVSAVVFIVEGISCKSWEHLGARVGHYFRWKRTKNFL